MTVLDEPTPGEPATSSRRLRTRSVGGTRAVAASLASWLEPGDVIVLSGDLGAGKTTFTQGLARELGVTEPVTSPTFTILQQYAGVRRAQNGDQRVLINHLDVYRLGSLDEAEALGLDELLDGEAVTLVEWGEGIERLLGASRLVITLRLAPVGEGASKDADDESIDHRLVTLELVGAEGSRHDGLDLALTKAIGTGDVGWEEERSC